MRFVNDHDVNVPHHCGLAGQRLDAADCDRVSVLPTPKASRHDPDVGHRVDGAYRLSVLHDELSAMGCDHNAAAVVANQAPHDLAKRRRLARSGRHDDQW